jgi:hypothetical protein
MTLLNLLNKAEQGSDPGFLRDGLRLLAQELMEAEVSQLIGAELHERSETRTMHRNGAGVPAGWESRSPGAAWGSPAPASPPGCLEPVPTSPRQGYCTWYVATRRNIPWFGNAIDWWPNARSYGYAEGQVPVVGAVMVTRESQLGHVAYVDSVGSDGSWTVSEMNYVAWNVVSRRTLRQGQTSVVGFIYGRT